MSEEQNKLPVKYQEPLVHLVATNPSEMAAAQSDLKRFLVAKIESLDSDIGDLNASINKAKEAKWNTSSLARLRNQAVDHQEFYAKILAAVEAGYTIVPDFPVDLFAIRVAREGPSHGPNSSRYGPPSTYLENPNILPPGEGEYVSPIPKTELTRESLYEKDGVTKYNLTTRTPIAFKEVVFPLRAARCEVMDATKSAMALKIFDQVGICPRGQRQSNKSRKPTTIAPLRSGPGRSVLIALSCVVASTIPLLVVSLHGAQHAATFIQRAHDGSECHCAKFVKTTQETDETVSWSHESGSFPQFSAGGVLRALAALGQLLFFFQFHQQLRHPRKRRESKWQIKPLNS